MHNLQKKRENVASNSCKNEDQVAEDLSNAALEEEEKEKLVSDITELSHTSEISSSSTKKEGEDLTCSAEDENPKSSEGVQKTIQNNSSKNEIDEQSFEALLAKNKAEISKIIAAEKLEDTAKLLPQTKQKDSLAKIIPYTETQLSALYRNGELEILDDFISQYVEAELKGIAIKQHPLFELLMNYLKVRERLTTNTVELNQLRKEYDDCKENLWTVEKTAKSVTGECLDGVRVTAKHVYDKATFHRTVFQTIVRILGNVRKLANEDHVLYSYTADDLKLQVIRIS